MGKVIQMADWKSRKAKQDPLGRGKTYVYKPNQDLQAGYHDRVYEYEKERALVRTTTDEQEEALSRIKALLKKSIESDEAIYQRPTVQGRESAAIASLSFHMQAVNVAKEHGITIRRRGPGIAVPKIFEVIAFGQILVVK